MAGGIVRPGQTLPRPGVGLIIQSADPAPNPRLGRFAYVGRSNWGPLGVATELGAFGAVEDTYGPMGPGNTFDAAEEAFRGGAVSGVGVRIGTGGTTGTITVQDTTATTPEDALKLTLKYAGTRAFSISIRPRADGDGKELVTYEGSIARESLHFANTTGTGNTEAQNLADAVASGSMFWGGAEVLNAGGNGTLATVSQVSVPPGTEPTIDADALDTALESLDAAFFRTISIDSEDPDAHLQLRLKLDDWVMRGKRRVGVVSEGPDVLWTTKRTNARSYNDPIVVYVANGFTRRVGASTVNVVGYQAAGRESGRIAASRTTEQLTHAPLFDAVSIISPLSDYQIIDGLQSGMYMYTLSERGRVWTEQGITTLIDPQGQIPQWAESMDTGWKKIRRVLTRWTLLDDISDDWDVRINVITNSPAGRAILISAGQQIINQMIGQDALGSGTLKEDPTHDSQGDTAYFVIDDLVDRDGAEKLIIDVRFSGQ